MELPVKDNSAGEDVIYGPHAVLEALRAGESLRQVLVAEGAERGGARVRVLAAARRAGVPVKRVPAAVLDRAVAGQAGARHQGVAAYTTGYRYRDLNELLARAVRRGEPPFLLALEAVQDVHNLGALLRTGEAVGVHGVLLPGRRAAGVTGAVRKASAGAVAHLAVARVDLPAALDALRGRSIAIVGLDAAGTCRYDQADLSGPLALLVGGEERGLSVGVRRRCDLLVHLPMRGRVDSLNAAVAGSVALYEALRQRSGRSAAAPEG